VLTGAIRALLAGPTAAERARGYGGWFSKKTAGHLRSVRVADGVAYVPAASRVPYSFDGSRRAFYQWLQRDVPPIRP
jgi:hypothetical protein